MPRNGTIRNEEREAAKRNWAATHRYVAYARAVQARCHALAGCFKTAPTSDLALDGRINPQQVEALVKINDRLATVMEMAGVGITGQAIGRMLAESLAWIEEHA